MNWPNRPLNEALVANSLPGLNQLAKGQLSMEREQYEPAVQYLQEALDWARRRTSLAKQLECLRSLGFLPISSSSSWIRPKKVLEESGFPGSGLCGLP